MNTERRQAIERQIVTHLIQTMAKHGWAIRYIDDGGDEAVYPTDEADALDTVFSVDECHIHFRKQYPERGMTHFAWIILGNDGWDCIADYSYDAQERDDFDQIMKSEINPFCEQFEEGA